MAVTLRPVLRWSVWRRPLITVVVLGVVAAGIGALSLSAMRRASAASSAPMPVVVPAITPTPRASASLPTSVAVSPTDRIDQAWAQRVSARTGIPLRALLAYAAASNAVASEQPGCGLGWNTLAGIGEIESGHASHAGAHLLDSGLTDRPIRGPALDGDGVAAIADSDSGAWDGDSRWDRAVGPMQFIPGTWRRWGSDGNADGVSDPNQIDDAALAAGRYLCASGSMSRPAGWRTAVLSYNHSDSYADRVASAATRYAQQAA